MELAGRFARTIYEPFWRKYHSCSDCKLPSPALVVETLRIAGLLHDIGHGPFSHLLDDTILRPEFALTHEEISSYLVTHVVADTIKRIRRTPEGDRLQPDETIDPEVVANLITTGREKNLSPIWRTLLPVIRGAYDADKMDFLLRDGACCGLQGLDKHEVERLILTSFIARGLDGAPVFLLDSSSRIPLMAFLRQRQYLMEAVYYHRTVRALEATIRPALHWATRQILPKSPIQDPESYLCFDEYKLHTVLPEALNTENTDSEAREYGRTWKIVNDRKIPWKQVYEYSEMRRNIAPAFRPDPESVVRALLETKALIPLLKEHPELKENILVDIPITNAPKEVTETAKAFQVLVHDRQSGKIAPVKPQEFEREGVFSHLVFCRVYLHNSCATIKPQVLEACREAFKQDASDITSF